MPIHNAEIAEMFNRLADLLEIEDANPFRVRAYRNAARTLNGLPRSVVAMLEEGEDLSRLPGIGKDLAHKIEVIVETGRLPALSEIERHTPSGLVKLLSVPGLGPKRVRLLHETLGIEDVEALASAARGGALRRLAGFGPKTEQNILHALETRGAEERRVKRIVAEATAEDLADYLRGIEGVVRVEIAGSYRRRRETVGDIDILAACGPRSPIIQSFIDYEDVAEVLSRGRKRSTVILRNGLQVDLRVVPEASYGAALYYFTGSKAHNIAVRTIGLKKGLKINEYGVFRGERRVAGRTEEEVFAQVGIPFIEPELREGRGEIEAARQGRLPSLIELSDIRGDLHVHSKASDGRATIAEMAKAAHARGYQYLSINDHSKRVTIAHGLDARRLARQLAEIDRLNEGMTGFLILKSTEVDILEDGTLDLPDDVLCRLDLTVCAVHSKFGLSRDRQTERIIRAMDNPCFDILGHPTGRLINERAGYEIDMERLLLAARERGCYLEVNAQPDRLDLTDLHCKMAKDVGVKVAISTDAHSVTDLDLMRFGLDQARRGWLEADDVLNTRRWPALKRLLRSR
ncbi:MAG TPA: DNA polymerase/3'-5' exonuclease PolX [Kiloniellales bacterium]